MQTLRIYIPIWLDLLFTWNSGIWGGSDRFTFQYGQIYYKYMQRGGEEYGFIYIPIWLDLLLRRNDAKDSKFNRFTFQYGQIYYNRAKRYYQQNILIYIPIWLDLLFLNMMYNKEWEENLHSNMVRFIICLNGNQRVQKRQFTFQYGQIYYI